MTPPSCTVAVIAENRRPFMRLVYTYRCACGAEAAGGAMLRHLVQQHRASYSAADGACRAARRQYAVTGRVGA